jgi:hypothetical protein
MSAALQEQPTLSTPDFEAPLAVFGSLPFGSTLFTQRDVCSIVSMYFIGFINDRSERCKFMHSNNITELVKLQLKFLGKLEQAVSLNRNR